MDKGRGSGGGWVAYMWMQLLQNDQKDKEQSFERIGI
jgi:hypothetical protein